MSKKKDPRLDKLSNDETKIKVHSKTSVTPMVVKTSTVKTTKTKKDPEQTKEVKVSKRKKTDKETKTSTSISENTELEQNPIKISSIKLTNYRFFYGDDDQNNKFDFDGKNVLIYGENGSGKSSLYKALELLAKNEIETGYFSIEKNLFSEDGSKIEFVFTNREELTLDSDTEDKETLKIRKPTFLNKLDIFKPMLDYKKLLNIHYAPNETKQINIYNMLKETLKDYPLKYQSEETTIFNIDSPTKRLRELENILNRILCKDINKFLSFFDKDFKISKFKKDIQDSENGKAEYVINMSIDFKNNKIDNYHTFLNEARLSSLAIAIYFASIKRLFNLIKSNSIKILVLDDLLISLDMSNRLKLLDILKNEFKNFQIIFFTHDKELFEIYKDKFDWKSFELYYDEKTGIAKSIKKESESLNERAKKQLDNKEYDLCAVLLRKDLERILKRYLEPVLKKDEYITLDGLIQKAIGLTPDIDNKKTILKNLDSHTKHILNPSSHNDYRNIYFKELEDAISELETLSELEKVQLKKILDKETQIKLTLLKDGNAVSYFGNIRKDLYTSNKYKILDCSCKITSNSKKNESLKGVTNESLLSLYNSVCLYLEIEKKENYYDFFEYKTNGTTEWLKLNSLF